MAKKWASLEAVPEAIREDVELVDGSYILKAEAERARLLAKNEQLLEEKQKGKLSPAERTELETFRQEKEKQEREAAKKAQDWEALDKQRDERHAKELEKIQKERDEAVNEVRDLLLGDSVDAAIGRAGVEPLFLGDHVRRRVKVVKNPETGRHERKIVREDGSPMLGKDNKEATLDDLLAEMKVHPVLGNLFPTDQGHGGGAQNVPAKKSTSRNPWKKGEENLTEQGRIMTENPSLAERLKAEAKQA